MLELAAKENLVIPERFEPLDERHHGAARLLFLRYELWPLRNASSATLVEKPLSQRRKAQIFVGVYFVIHISPRLPILVCHKRDLIDHMICPVSLGNYE